LAQKDTTKGDKPAFFNQGIAETIVHEDNPCQNGPIAALANSYWEWPNFKELFPAFSEVANVIYYPLQPICLFAIP
jgi:hypothetical protein